MKAIHVRSRELKNRLSQYLRRVKAGETVIVTERGKAAGVLDWDGRQTPPYRPKPVNRRGRLLSDLVAEERE